MVSKSDRCLLLQGNKGTVGSKYLENYVISCPHDAFKKFARRLPGVFKASLGPLQDDFKTYHSKKIVLVNNSPTLSQNVLQRRSALATLPEEFMVKVQIF